MNGAYPRVIRPSIKAGGKEKARGIHVQLQSAIAIAAVEAAVLVAVVEVAAPAEIMAMVVVPALHVTRTAAFTVDAAVVGALNMDSAVSVQPMMDVHAALGVMYIADSATWPPGYRGAVTGNMRSASLGRYMPGRRVWSAAGAGEV